MSNKESARYESRRRADEYRDLRRQLGTQETVAPLLGISSNALSDRENAHAEIRQESFLALHALLAMRGKVPAGAAEPREIRSV
jgi:hypothetical protein